MNYSYYNTLQKLRYKITELHIQKLQSLDFLHSL